jgi:hypothetical protein
MSLTMETPADLAHREPASIHESSDPVWHTIESPIRTLSISSHSWRGNLRIVDANNTALLYKVDWSIRKPMRLTITGPDHDTTLGSITFHVLTTRIDAMVHEHSIALKPKGMMCKEFSYTSPSFENRTLTWQYQGQINTFHLTCLNEDSMPVARITLETWGIKKLGTIEICDERASSGPAMDEIVVVGMAVAEYCLMLSVGAGGALVVVV